MIKKIPLFPLKTIVLPEEILPLHIFENRYKSMISKCLDSDDMFGIIYRNDNQFSRIGCEVNIKKLLKEYEDGKYDILVKGQKRFEIINFFKEDDLWYGEIKKIDEKYDFMNKKIFSKILDKYLQILLYYNINHDIQEEMKKSKSFDFTKNVVIPITLKQEFLELKDELERMNFIEKILDSIINNSDEVQNLNFKEKTLN